MMLARVVDLTVVYSIARFRYGFHLTAQAVKGFALALLAGSVVLLSSCFSAAIPALRYLGPVVVALAVCVACYGLSRNGKLFTTIFRKLFKRWKNI